VPTPPRRASRITPEPLDADAVRPVAVGTVLWFAGFLVLLPFHGRLVESGHELWLWTCLAGGGLGIIGLILCLRHRAAVRASRAPAPASAGAAPTPPTADPGDG
jgi:Protein of unknown function (DUF2530)